MPFTPPPPHGFTPPPPPPPTPAASNVYNPGSGQHSSADYARQEISDAHLQESAGSLQLEDDPIYEEKEEEDPNDNELDNSSSPNLNGSMAEIWDSDDPNTLYQMVEDAMPKQSDSKDLKQKRDILDLTWERIRRWLWSHPDPIERQTAVNIRGQNDCTVLHLVCKLRQPPEDIVLALCVGDAATWADSHGWLPIHHACANGISPEALQTLIEAYPAGKLQADHQQRTPLHFYATRAEDNPTAMAQNTLLLSDTGAAELSDGGGMLPLHYACAYGTHPAVLQVLAEAFPESLVALEDHGRSPMHLAMVNAHRDASPGVMRFLLERESSRQTVNSRDRDGYLPLHLMALGLKGYRAEDPDKRTNVCECLEMYLGAEPVAAADFLTAIQDLPDWLQDTAVVNKHVRNILNDKIVQRFPASILMLDGFFLVLLIVSFAFCAKNHIELRFGVGEEEDRTESLLVVLLVGATYFLTRELVQIASLMSLGSLSQWFFDPANWLDITVIVLVFYYSIIMVITEDASVESDDAATFRTGVTFTQGILWVAIIVYLKSTLVDFAVFVGGLFNVVQRLVAFLLAVGVIMVAFAQMFYFVYVDTDICDLNITVPQAFPPEDPDEYFNPDLIECAFPHCSFDESLLKVYTMMMGEIGDVTRYSTNFTAEVLFVGYAFLVVILLSNVLIAIVTDSYEIIQNDRAAIVFWSNRLDFVAEMDAIVYAVQRRFWKTPPQIAGTLPEQQQREQQQEQSEEPWSPTNSDRSHDYFRKGWHQVILLFDENLYDDVEWIETGVYNIFRIFCIFVVIPLWLGIGFLSAGWLWPPQVREYLFVQRDVVVSRSELERKKLEKLKAIQTDLRSMKQEIMREMANDRDEMTRMKTEVDTIQSEVLADLMQVKELMNSLLLM